MTGIIVAVIVIAVLCGWVSAVIAGSKGLPSGGYFLAGLFLGIIGIIIAAVAQPARVAVPQVAAPPGWYPDPSGGPWIRWWDGVQWTDARESARDAL